MRRFYLAPEYCQESSLVLTGSEAHHARHVLRVRRGDRVVVLDGMGHSFECEVEGCGAETVRLIVAKKHSHPPLPGQVTLLQAVPKGKTMEVIVQRATELGASRIVPLLSERVVAHLDSQEAAHKTSKWQVAAREAVKQCGSPWLPRVDPPVSPADFLARKETFDLPLVASLQSGSRILRDYFHAFRSERGRTPGSICVWVGPEGDFTASELSALESHGVLAITLGRLIMRTETAALYCLSVLNYELQSSSSAVEPSSRT
jgi:16S rRNA (uracil1498-N3)-methyltransferase